jgi:hypothetical protein
VLYLTTVKNERELPKDQTECQNWRESQKAARTRALAFFRGVGCARGAPAGALDWRWLFLLQGIRKRAASQAPALEHWPANAIKAAICKRHRSGDMNATDAAI